MLIPILVEEANLIYKVNKKTQKIINIKIYKKKFIFLVNIFDLFINYHLVL